MPKILRPALFAGTAAVALAGLAGAAAAQSPQRHVVTIALPGGGVEAVYYSGNVAPRIRFLPGPAAAFATLPAMSGPDSPFAELDRVAAEMDRQAASLFREAQMMASAPAQFSEAAMRNLPPGSRSYSYVATLSGNGACARSTTITAPGNGAPPKVVTKTSGDCSAVMSRAPETLGLPRAPIPAQRARLMEANAAGAEPYAGLVHPIPTSWQR